MTPVINKLSKLFNYLYCLLVYRGNMIVVNGWLNIKYGKIMKRNFGDELNYYLLKELTGRPIVGYYDIPHVLKHRDYLVIGSLVEEFTTPHSIIWGSGAISGDKPLRHRPAKVCAVRGKLTRNYLIGQGVDCPEVYGDPALLLPLIYKPSVYKKYKLGIVPHIADIEDPIVKKMAEDDSVKVIQLNKYDHWHDVIDEINQCDMVASSSLHGLIIADAYNIPNVWIRLSDKIEGGNFKYLDYFSAVGRETIEPLEINDNIRIETIIEKVGRSPKIHFDINPLIKSCPLEISKKFKNC